MSDSPAWMADVKAALAREGQTLSPEAKLKTIDKPRPGTSGALVVLERVRKDELPDYCIHGYASCVVCDKLCWLGSETRRVVADSEAFPICVECAKTTIPASDGVKMTRVEDHMRADGPHDD